MCGTALHCIFLRCLSQTRVLTMLRPHLHLRLPIFFNFVAKNTTHMCRKKIKIEHTYPSVIPYRVIFLVTNAKSATSCTMLSQSVPSVQLYYRKYAKQFVATLRQQQHQPPRAVIRSTMVISLPKNDPESPIYKSMCLLMHRIAELVLDSVPESVKDSNNFPTMMNAFTATFNNLIRIIFRKSQSYQQSEQQSEPMAHEDANIEIKVIAEYVVATFTDTYASQFKLLLDEFGATILDASFDPSKEASRLIKIVAVHEDRVAHIGRLLDCIASFGTFATHLDTVTFPLSRDNMISSLEKTRAALQIGVHRIKCMLAIIVIITRNIDATILFRATLSQVGRGIICEHVIASIADIQQIHADTYTDGNATIKNHVQQCRMLFNAMLFNNACYQRMHITNATNMVYFP